MLKQKDCAPCKKGTPPLTVEQAAGYLGYVEGWDIVDEGRCILRSFAFPDFKNALAFVNNIADIAEAEQHHPDITFGWGYCTVLFTTHAVKGLHENDFIMAAKVNELAGV